MKTSLDISCELSAWQTIQMKCQDLFSLKNKKKKKKLRMSSAANFAWCFRVNKTESPLTVLLCVSKGNLLDFLCSDFRTSTVRR